jgi:transcriptional regulator with XRE-family HTH domain
MKQPELGIKISEIRSQRSITQKELSEACKIDIRTIQRIESGDVSPRISTLKLIANALSSDLNTFNGDHQENASLLSPQILLSFFVTGIIYLISWVLFAPIFPKNDFLLSVNLLVGCIQTITGVFFYFGFYNLGKLQNNGILSLSSIITMVCIPLFLITLLVSSSFGFAEKINQVIIILMGINSVIFGIGLLRVKNQWMNWYKITGVLQIVLAPFFILPIPTVNLVGCWITIPFIILLISIFYMEFKEARNQHLTLEMV